MDSSADAPVSLPVTDTGVTAADRRGHPRFSAKVQMELRREGDDVPMRTETTDLSRSGCYLQLSLTLAVGTYVQGKLWIADSAVKFRGQVVTSHPQFGNGIMFLQFEGNGEQILASFLDAIVV
jgi:PilZ domain